MSRAWRWYSRTIRDHPLACKSVTTGVLFAAGDVLCQAIEAADVGEGEEFTYNPARTAKMAAVGLCWTGPVLHVYFNMLSKVPFFANMRPLALTLFDQTVACVFLTSTFFLLMGTAEGVLAHSPRPFADATALVAAQLWPTLLANWCVWPVLNFLSFSYVPVHLRVLWASCWGVLWNAYLSYMANRDGETMRDVSDAGVVQVA